MPDSSKQCRNWIPTGCHCSGEGRLRGRLHRREHTTRRDPISRGNIQVNTLSPFLFTLFMEPLMRWLHVNERGYRCATAPQLVVSASAYADDLLIAASNTTDLNKQAAKVHAFAAWTAWRCPVAKALHWHHAQPYGPVNNSHRCGLPTQTPVAHTCRPCQTCHGPGQREVKLKVQEPQ